MNYDLIYCDPPWEYGNRISNGAACNHYSTMSIEDLKRLPVWSLAADNAVLAMWYTGTHAADVNHPTYPAGQCVITETVLRAILSAF